MSLAQLEREVRILKGYAILSTAGLMLAFLTTFATAQGPRQRFTELDVERVNIVEPDGRIALAITNTQRMPGPVIEGKELPRELSQGRVVWDRPTNISLNEIIAAAQSTKDPAELKKRFAELAKERGETSLGAQRVFLGSLDQTAALRLMDTTGRERVRITVDASNTPRMDFLDAQGTVVYSLPR